MVDLSATTIGFSEYSTLALGTRGWQTSVRSLLNIKEFILYIQQEHVFPLDVLVKVPFTTSIIRSKAFLVDIARDLTSKLRIAKDFTYNLDLMTATASTVVLTGEITTALSFSLQVDRSDNQNLVIAPNLTSEVVIETEIQRVQEFKLYIARSYNYIFEIPVK